MDAHPIDYDFYHQWSMPSMRKLILALIFAVPIYAQQPVVTVSPSTSAVTQTTSPWIVGITTWGNGTLGAMANYGTSPGAVLVPGVNAFVTNFPASQAVTGTFWPYSLGQQLAAASVPVILPAATITALTPLTSVTVTQATGTNLHAVLDTTSTTAVTQATASNLNAAVVGIFAADGAAAATNREATLDAIAQTSYANGTALTAGRNEALSVGTDGLLWTANLPAIRPASYHASASFAGSSTTVNAHLSGNATNTVLVTKVSMSCTQTTAGIVTVTVNKTSAASSGGTAATMTVVPDDSNYSAGSSAAQSFTGTGPTAGTPVGQIDAYKLGCMATGTASPNDIYILNLRQKPIVLRGTAQTLEIGAGGAITGGNVVVTWEWIETATILP